VDEDCRRRNVPGVGRLVADVEDLNGDRITVRGEREGRLARVDQVQDRVVRELRRLSGLADLDAFRRRRHLPLPIACARASCRYGHHRDQRVSPHGWFLLTSFSLRRVRSKFPAPSKMRDLAETWKRKSLGLCEFSKSAPTQCSMAKGVVGRSSRKNAVFR